jgi:pimeloyl-ACP methyl ester carboxylesterase
LLIRREFSVTNLLVGVNNLVLELLLQSILVTALIIFIYLCGCLVIMLVLAKFPRNPLPDTPDWGIKEEYWIPTVNNKKLECWVVRPDENLNNRTGLKDDFPAVILLHGWGRNRGRMVTRARIYGEKGYTTILFSARDHGQSDKELIGMSIIRFTQDLKACIDWWGKPVVLCGHSIGGGAALLAGAQNSHVKAIIAESPPYAFPFSLKYVYQPALKILTPILMPGITFITLRLFRRFKQGEYSPLASTTKINVPTLIIHGKQDIIFPYEYSLKLSSRIKYSTLWTPENGTHYNHEFLPEYRDYVLKFLNQNLK